MPRPGPPSVDVHARLDAAEWRELFREALRVTGFWRRTVVVALVVAVAAVVAAALGAPGATVLGVTATALVIVVAFTASYALLGPRLRWPRVPSDTREVHWRVHADRIEADRAGAHLDLEWNDIDQVIVTRRLVVLRLGARRPVLGLPRRCATTLGESLIVTWAEDSGAEVVHRRGGHPSPGHPPVREP